MKHEQLNVFDDALQQAELAEINPHATIELNELALLREMADLIYPRYKEVNPSNPEGGIKWELNG